MPLVNPGTSAQTWTDATLQNSWVNFGSPFGSAQYSRDAANVVRLRGMVKDGGSSTAIFTLPTGFRPTQRRVFLVAAGGSGFALTLGRIDVHPDGQVIAYDGGNTYRSLDGISFTV